MHKVKLLSIAVLLALLVSAAAGVALAQKPPPQPMWWGTVTAYAVKIAFCIYGVDCHYGAFFSGKYGHNQHYLGPGGDAATCQSSAGCISNWNWWGSDRNVLLLPRSWLFGELPWWWGPRWQPSNYQARVWID